MKKHKDNKSDKSLMIIAPIALTGGILLGFSIGHFVQLGQSKGVPIDDTKELAQEVTSSNDNLNELESESITEETINGDSAEIETEVKSQEQQKSISEKKETKEDKINKAKQAIIKETKGEFSDVEYALEGKHPTKGGNYYIFNMGEYTGDIIFYVDTQTYKVYEHSVDGYFGPYRDGNSDIFTYDMAVIKLENELGWDEDRRFTFIEEKTDGFIIQTSFEVEGGSGTGDIFYVTRDSVDVVTGSYR